MACLTLFCSAMASLPFLLFNAFPDERTHKQGKAGMVIEPIMCWSRNILIFSCHGSALPKTIKPFLGNGGVRNKPQIGHRCLQRRSFSKSLRAALPLFSVAARSEAHCANAFVKATHFENSFVQGYRFWKLLCTGDKL